MSGSGTMDMGLSQANISTTLTRVRDSIAHLTNQQQWLLVYHLIHERLGDNPQKGFALTDEHGCTYLFLSPPHLLNQGTEEAEHTAPTGTTISAGQFLEIIHDVDDPETTARRLYELGGVAR